MPDEELDRYYRDAESWSADRERMAASSKRIAWLVAGAACAVAVLEAIALIVLLPLKTVVPYTLLVDRQTGYVQALRAADRQTVAPDEALTRSLLAQYVIAREGFEIDTLQADYRKIALWSADPARAQYLAHMQATDPTSPLSTLPRQALVDVEVRSISPLGGDAALVRFATTRSDPGRAPEPAQPWVAVIRYRFSGAAMSAADRLVNPLGFQVLRYRRDAEIVPLPGPPTSQRAVPGSQAPSSGQAR